MESCFLPIIDLFGRPVTIKYFGKEKFNSRFGAVCSLLFFGFLGWVLYNESIDLFNKQNPITINSEVYVEDPPAMLLSLETFPIAVQLQAPESRDYISFLDESIYTVEFTYSIYRVIKDELGNDVSELKEYTLAKEICTPSHFGELADTFSKLPLSLFYCIAKNQPEIQQIFIQGSDSSPVYDYLSVMLVECNDETSSVPCAPEDIKNAYLSGAWVYVYHPNLAINPNNYTHPDLRSRDSYTTMLSRRNYKETYLRLSQMEIVTDVGWIIPSPETKKFIKSNQAVEYLQFDPREDKVLMTCIFEPSRTSYHWSRTYKTIQKVLAEVGGLANVMLVALYTITTPYLRLKFRESLINELFDLHPLPSKGKKSQKNNVIRPISLGSKLDNRKNEKRSPRSQNELHANLELSEKNLNKKSYIKSYINSEKTYAVSELSNNEGDGRDNTSLKKLNAKDKQSTPSLTISPSKMSLHIPKQDKQDKRSRNPRRYFSLKNLLVPKDNHWHKYEADTLPAPSSKVQSYNLDIHPELPQNTVHTQNTIRAQRPPTILIPKRPDGPKPDYVLSPKKPGGPFHRILPKKYYYDDTSAIFTEDAFSDFCAEDKEHNKHIKIEFPSSAHAEPKSEETNKMNQNTIEPNTSLVVKAPERSFSFGSVINPHNKVKSGRINLTLWEYIASFFYKSKSLKQKMDLLNEGIGKIDSRLDVIAILKKMREIDKLKAILFDLDQNVLFDNLPKPELRPKATKQVIEPMTTPLNLLRKSTFQEYDATVNSVIDLRSKLERKVKKTKMDQRFIAVFKDNLDDPTSFCVNHFNAEI